MTTKEFRNLFKFNEKELNIRVGKVIKKHRELKNISQSKLTDELNPQKTICCIKTLRRLEQGKGFSMEVLCPLLKTLEMSFEVFISYVNFDYMTIFNNEFSIAWEHFTNSFYDEANKCIEVIKSSNAYDFSDPLINQAMLLYNSCILFKLNLNIQNSLDNLYKAIRLTSPHEIASDNLIDCTIVAIRTFSLSEYRILCEIAIIANNESELPYQSSIFKAVLQSLNNKTVAYNIKNVMIPVTCYNLSDTLNDMKLYNESIKTCDSGILFCKQIGRYKFFPFLYYSKAKALFHLTIKEEALINFKLSYNSFITQDKNEMAEKVKKIVFEKYKMII